MPTYVHTPHNVCGSQRVIVANVVQVVASWPINPILGFWGRKVHKNGRFLALNASELPRKI